MSDEKNNADKLKEEILELERVYYDSKVQPISRIKNFSKKVVKLPLQIFNVYYFNRLVKSEEKFDKDYLDLTYNKTGELCRKIANENGSVDLRIITYEDASKLESSLQKKFIFKKIYDSKIAINDALIKKANLAKDLNSYNEYITKKQTLKEEFERYCKGEKFSMENIKLFIESKSDACSRILSSIASDVGYFTSNFIGKKKSSVNDWIDNLGRTLKFLTLPATLATIVFAPFSIPAWGLCLGLFASGHILEILPNKLSSRKKQIKTSHPIFNKKTKSLQDERNNTHINDIKTQYSARSVEIYRELENFNRQFNNVNLSKFTPSEQLLICEKSSKKIAYIEKDLKAMVTALNSYLNETSQSHLVAMGLSKSNDKDIEIIKTSIESIENHILVDARHKLNEKIKELNSSANVFKAEATKEDIEFKK